MSGGPDWLDSAHFDVMATAGGNTTTDEFGAMLRALLGERFKLAVHRETREVPIYSLMSTPSISAKLHRSDQDCFGGGGAPPAAAPDQQSQCGFRMGFGTMSGTGVSMAALAGSLAMRLSRPVLDHTGLTGGFDIDLKWTPELPAGASGAPADQPVRVNGVVIDPNGPSIFTAVQEQLGLKLESTKGPVEILVIDSAEKPTEN